MQEGRVFDNESLGEIPRALQVCDQKCLDVSLELELRGSLDSDKVHALQAAVQQNDRITNVKLQLKGAWEEVSSANRIAVANIIDTACHLPNLKEFVIVGDFVPLPAISNLLRHSVTLQTLKLEQLRNLRSCDTGVIVDFCSAIRRHGALKFFSLHPHISDSSEPQEDALVNLLLESLAGIPTLEHIAIVTNTKSFAGEPLVELCHSATLVKLELNPRGEVSLNGLEALAKNQSIQELLVTCTYSDHSSAALFQLIQSNATLKTLTVVYHEAWRDDDSYDQYVLPLAQALKTNTTLSGVKFLMGTSNYPSIPILKAFLEMIKTNYVLHDLELFGDESRVQWTCYEELQAMKDERAKEAILLGKRIRYFTILNRSGRGGLLQNPTESANRIQWVEKLVEYSYSIDHIYFFLRTNPALCCQEAASAASPEDRKRGRQDD